MKFFTWIRIYSLRLRNTDRKDKRQVPFFILRTMLLKLQVKRGVY